MFNRQDSGGWKPGVFSKIPRAVQFSSSAPARGAPDAAVRLIRLAICLLALGPLSSVTHAAELVGSVVPPFPQGTFEGRGACIGDDPKNVCEQSIGIVVNATKRELLIYTGRAARRDEKGGAYWLVTATLQYPQVGKGQQLEYGTCRNGGVNDSSIIAVVRASKHEFLQASGWAYRVDRLAGNFVKLNPVQVDCVNTALDAN